MLRYSRKSSADMLDGSECGVQKMDDFIHNSLDDFLKNDPRFSFFIAEEEDLGI